MTNRHLYLIDPDSEIDSWMTPLQEKIEWWMDKIARIFMVCWCIWAAIEVIK